MANNLISTMVMSRRCSKDEKEGREVKRLVQDITELAGKFNLSDYIWFCKNLDLQGIRKRLKVLHNRLDGMIEKIINEHPDERKELKQRSEEAEVGKDLLHILLDIAEDESSKMKLTRENIKAFVLLDVRGQHYHFLPFGSGRRGCPGTSLALLVVQTTLAAMIQCFEWKVEGGNGTVDMEEEPGITVPKAQHLVCFPQSGSTM
ncbi:cytochrome [Sesamum alatum]|uniref:Cytochrome n=1 Tax=Sesamum alatum TaxID=300844 RepID=A0AAE1XJI7_9LAMI|nr:cytochrome [Sesamum alatum]